MSTSASRQLVGWSRCVPVFVLGDVSWPVLVYSLWILVFKLLGSRSNTTPREPKLHYPPPPLTVLSPTVVSLQSKTWTILKDTVFLLPSPKCGTLQSAWQTAAYTLRSNCDIVSLGVDFFFHLSVGKDRRSSREEWKRPAPVVFPNNSCDHLTLCCKLCWKKQCVT